MDKKGQFELFKKSHLAELRKELEECELVEKGIKSGEIQFQSFSGVIEMYNRQIQDIESLTFTTENMEKIQKLQLKSKN